MQEAARLHICFVKYTYMCETDILSMKGKKNTCMSSAIPNALFSKGVDAPAADARRHSPSDNAPAPIDEYLSLSKVSVF